MAFVLDPTMSLEVRYPTHVIQVSSLVVPKPVPASQVDVGLEHFQFA